MIIHHCLTLNTNITPTYLNTYVTHPTGAGPGGPLAHTDVPWGHPCQTAGKATFGGTTCHSYYPEIRNGYHDYFNYPLLPY